MQSNNILKNSFLITFLSIQLLGCKKWDDHNENRSPLVGKDIYQQIKENENLSKFSELLLKTGYDKTLASSKTFTVFAPTNAALANIDPAIVVDSLKLNKFVGNHIANQLYNTNTVTTELRILMLNGKYNNLKNKSIEVANIIEANKFAKNGLLQIVDKVIPVLDNTWEFLETNTLSPANQKAYLFSLYQNIYDTINAIQVGVNPDTGEPIYQAGTDSVKANVFLKNVYDLRDESKQFTFFALQDTSWDVEVNKYKPYLKWGNNDSTTKNASWGVIKDFAVEGLYTPENMPDTILSKFNVKMGVQKTAIVRSVRTSNGIVHIMSSLNVQPQQKFLQYIIQAENVWAFSNSRPNNTYYRDRYNPITNKNFRDVLVYNHGVALYTLAYRIFNVPAIKYRAYWVALHDNINGMTTTFTQKLDVFQSSNANLPYTTVGINNYQEVYAGEFTLSKFAPTLQVGLVAANNTVATTNPIVCDYIRLEPVF